MLRYLHWDQPLAKLILVYAFLFFIPEEIFPNTNDPSQCVWQYVVNDMVEEFTGPSGRCTTAARGAVRLGFHDASGWSKSTGPTGGADGSIILNPDELTSDKLNQGMEAIVATTKRWADKYAKYGVGVADTIQMGANVATVVCPLGPRVKTYVGRKDSNKKAPAPIPGDGKDTADHLLKLFADKTISADDVVALIGAHSVAQQRFADVARSGDPLDSTPGVWDTAYYTQIVSPMAPPRVFKLQSDINIAIDPRTARLFAAFAAPNNGAQVPWNKVSLSRSVLISAKQVTSPQLLLHANVKLQAYAKAYVRLSLLGVDNINDLTDCTKVLPAEITKFKAVDTMQMKEWTSMTTNMPAIAKAIFDAKLITNVTDFETILGEQQGQTPEPNPTEPDDAESDSESK